LRLVGRTAEGAGSVNERTLAKPQLRL
jgi:hypothetical protein